MCYVLMYVVCSNELLAVHYLCTHVHPDSVAAYSKTLVEDLQNCKNVRSRLSIFYLICN